MNWLDTMTTPLSEISRASAFLPLSDEFLSGRFFMVVKKATSPPTIDEAIKYAQRQIEYYKQRIARYESVEHQEEMAQEALFRVFRKHKHMRAEGWRAFCQRLIKGAFIGYLRVGKGFEERKKSLRHANGGAPFVRLSPKPNDENEMTHEKILDLKIGGIQLEEIEFDGVDWDLISRMARGDHGLHILVRHFFREEPMSTLTDIFGVSRERIGQRLQDFLDGFNGPPLKYSSWRRQVIFALGLSCAFDLPSVDTGEGWTYEPVDFERREVFQINWAKRQTAMELDGGCDLPACDNADDESCMTDIELRSATRISCESMDAHLQMEWAL
jgi:hypothetical protein